MSKPLTATEIISRAFEIPESTSLTAAISKYRGEIWELLRKNPSKIGKEFNIPELCRCERAKK